MVYGVIAHNLSDLFHALLTFEFDERQAHKFCQLRFSWIDIFYDHLSADIVIGNDADILSRFFDNNKE